MDLSEALHHALDGNAVLFTGAGFSCEAINKEGKNLFGDELAACLAADSGLSYISTTRQRFR